MIECVLCGHLIDRKMHEGKVYWTEGNNAQPLADGRCCDMCDCILVIPSRMGMYQENITKATVPVKGQGSENFSIRVDRIKFLNDDDRNEIDVRVWSNTGRPSKKGIRLTTEQARIVHEAMGAILEEVENNGTDSSKSS